MPLRFSSPPGERWLRFSFCWREERPTVMFPDAQFPQLFLLGLAQLALEAIIVLSSLFLRSLMPIRQSPIVTPTGEQQQAIEHVEGPMLVVAGAGTGKTTVLVRRIAQLIESWRGQA